MVKNGFVFLLSLSLSSLAIANELTVVQAEYIDTVAAVTSVLVRKGVADSNLILIGDSDGMTDQNTWMFAMGEAAQRTPIVLSAMGPVNNDVCAVLAKKSEVAFVLVSGDDSVQVNNHESPNCMARNLLFVGSLDGRRENLAPFSNWGIYVRIAAPGQDIFYTDKNGVRQFKSGGTMSSTLVAGNLVQYARTHQALKGAELIDAFLRDRTVVLPALFGKIQGSLALDDKDL